jgi:hypothetical protein
MHIYRTFVCRHVALWKAPLLDALHKAVQIVDEAGSGLIEHHAFLSRRLATKLTQILASIVESRLERARSDDMVKLLADETYPMTLNHYYMDTFNKMGMEGFEKVLAETDSQARESIYQASGMAVSMLKPDIVKSSLMKWYTEHLCIGKSNASQVRLALLICLRY